MNAIIFLIYSSVMYFTLFFNLFFFFYLHGYSTQYFLDAPEYFRLIITLLNVNHRICIKKNTYYTDSKI